jgi:hypothetical protein
MIRLFAALLTLAAGFAPLHAQAVFTGTLGTTSRDHFKGAHFAYTVGLHLKFDEMILIGVQSGQGTLAGSRAIPITAAAMVRLPIGRIVLPVAIGDLGYALVQDPGFLWRAGGGFDIRNGRRSSFLLLGGYEQQGTSVGWFGRGGILLEF